MARRTPPGWAIVPRLSAFLSLIPLLALAPSASADSLDRTAVSSSGFSGQGGGVHLQGTLAEAAVVGRTSSPAHRIDAGFWSGRYRLVATGVAPEAAAAIRWANSLRGGFPNPFPRQTTIGFTVARRSSVRLEIFDVTGRRVATLVRDVKDPGSYRVHWSGRDDSGLHVASGVYLSRLDIGSWSDTKKILKLR